MTFPIFKALKATATLPFMNREVIIPELKEPEAALALRPDRYRVVAKNQAVASEGPSLISRNLFDGNVVILRNYHRRFAADPTMMIHDEDLNVDGSWDERVESWRRELRHGMHYMIFIQGALYRQLSTKLVDYLVYRGMRSYGEIVVPTDGLFHVTYRPDEDAIAIHSGPRLWTYPGFFNSGF